MLSNGRLYVYRWALTFLLASYGCHKQVHNPYHFTEADPIYFHQMVHAHDLESHKKYDEAIMLYNLALSHINDVAPDLRVQGAIAAHNRMAACYHKKCDLVNSLKQFEISKQLGDMKYAPKSIQKMNELIKSNSCKKD